MIRSHRPNEILELADLSTVVGTGALPAHSQIGSQHSVALKANAKLGKRCKGLDDSPSSRQANLRT